MVNHAAVFPGQGSQSVGMLKELADRHPLVKDLFASVSERLGYDLWQLVQSGPEEKLNQTMYTQVAVLTADVSVYRVMVNQNDFRPSVMAGHSLGEYAALVCAQAIELEDAAELVSTRGQLMQETMPLGLGAMAAIVGLTDEQVEDICTKASSDVEIVTPANFNAIGQVVIAGNTSAVDKAIVFANDMGARLARIIPVSVPCHCPLLKEASAKFESALENANFTSPKVPVISNVDLSVYESTQQIRKLLAKQLYSPVQWVKTIQEISKRDVELVVECGPGKVLSGLIKRIDNTLQTKQAIAQLLI
ncbi:MAG: ACP S-malonyltransferase [Legionellaceae bacterium]|nr:ACP S-malonyltransferase [Legionellaceae bacterium]